MASPARTQPTISSYFASTSSSPLKTNPKATRTTEKRSASSNFVDLTQDDADEAPITKKSKSIHWKQNGVSSVAEAPKTPSKTTAPRIQPEAGPSTPRNAPQTPAVGSAQKYRFTDKPDVPDVNETPEEKRAKKARREAFKRKLLSDNGLFRRTSRRPEESSPGSPADNVVDVDSEVDISEAGDKSSGSESDLEPSTLPETIRSAAFFQKEASVAKRRTIDNRPPFKKSRSIPEEEVGPSGKTFTPLEKQVSGILCLRCSGKQTSPDNPT